MQEHAQTEQPVRVVEQMAIALRANAEAICCVTELEPVVAWPPIVIRAIAPRWALTWVVLTEVMAAVAKMAVNALQDTAEVTVVLESPATLATPPETVPIATMATVVRTIFAEAPEFLARPQANVLEVIAEIGCVEMEV